MQSLSRRKVANYVARQLQSGDKALAMRQAAAYLVTSKKTKQVDLFVAEVENALARQFGAVKVTVVTAHELNDSLRTQIKSFISSKQTAEQIELVEEIDQSIVGGVIIRTPTAEFDASIRNSLNQLKA